MFASGGISEIYLNETNVDIVLANELLQERCNFYYEYYKSDIICGSICDKNIYKEIIQKSKEKNVDFVMATPPCQGMSKAGRMQFDDPRNVLFLYIINIIKELKPKYCLIENVPEFIKTNYLDIDTKQSKPIMEKIKEELLQHYNIDYSVLNAQDFGVPQSRKRAIVLLSRKDLPIWNIPNTKMNIITVRETIGHLISLESNEKCIDKNNKIKDQNMINWHNSLKHNDNHILWMKHTPSGMTAFKNKIHFPQKDGRKIKGFNTTYKRIDWDKPSPTITMSSGSISSQNNVHPGRKLNNDTYSDARALTIYELMLLNSIKKDWNIPKMATDKLLRHLFGESVPPMFMKNIILTLPSQQ